MSGKKVARERKYTGATGVGDAYARITTCVRDVKGGVGREDARCQLNASYGRVCVACDLTVAVSHQRVA